MAVQKRLRRLPRTGLQEPQTAMRRDQAEEGDLLAPTADLDHRPAEIGLRMARRMVQRREGLARRPTPRAHMVLHDRVAARDPVLVTQPFQSPLRRVPLLDRQVGRPVRFQVRIDDPGEPLQLRTPDRLPAPVAGGAEQLSIFFSVRRSIPNRQHPSQWLNPSSITASRTAAQSSAPYISRPAPIPTSGYLWCNLAPPDRTHTALPVEHCAAAANTLKSRIVGVRRQNDRNTAVQA